MRGTARLLRGKADDTATYSIRMRSRRLRYTGRIVRKQDYRCCYDIIFEDLQGHSTEDKLD